MHIHNQNNYYSLIANSFKRKYLLLQFCINCTENIMIHFILFSILFYYIFPVKK